MKQEIGWKPLYRVWWQVIHWVAFEAQNNNIDNDKVFAREFTDQVQLYDLRKLAFVTWFQICISVLALTEESGLFTRPRHVYYAFYYSLFHA